MGKYWIKYEKGLKFETHGKPEDPYHYWASYLPASCLKQENAGKKYPMIILLHGAGNSIEVTQTYGVVQLAAKEEIIVIIPENEREDNLLDLLLFAKENYPVDMSRVYLVGFSFGSMRSAAMGIMHSDLFAGLGMGGMVTLGEVNGFELTGIDYPEVQIKDKQIEIASSYGMTTIILVGENEFINLVPFQRNDAPKTPPINVDLSSDMKYKTRDVYRRLAGCSKEPETQMVSKTLEVVEQNIGVKFERAEIRSYKERTYYIGDNLSIEGECKFRIAAIEGLPHIPSIRFAELVWEQIGKYYRDPDTKQLKLIDSL
jgi:hypothetical protein